MREKRRENPLIMVDGVFVRALNENRTRGLPLRRRTLYPLSYKGDGTFRSFNDVRLCRAVFGMVLIDVAPETIAAKRASSPPVLNDGWRESGDWIGFSPATSRTNGKVQIPSGRAACSVANHPAGPCSPWASRFRYACSATPMKTTH